jgi:predicted 2-oxoglutarate/Fe(II)-dependent dioxygenase YbiX
LEKEEEMVRAQAKGVQAAEAKGVQAAEAKGVQAAQATEAKGVEESRQQQELTDLPNRPLFVLADLDKLLVRSYMDRYDPKPLVCACGP